jgi:transposase
MMDNLSVHRTQRLNNAIVESGHLWILRPAYSPDYAPVESAFSKIKAFLRARRYELTTENIVRHIVMTIQTITVEDCMGWFRNCGYY